MGDIIQFRKTSERKKVEEYMNFVGRVFSTKINGLVIQAKVLSSFFDEKNKRVVLTLDLKAKEDGRPICLDLYPFGVPVLPKEPPFGNHVPVKATFLKVA